jgi:hypothetical protein
MEDLIRPSLKVGKSDFGFESAWISVLERGKICHVASSLVRKLGVFRASKVIVLMLQKRRIRPT